MGFVPNDRQRQAIEHVHGAMLVVAGAGTGKTTVLAQRVAHLIANGHVRPDQILALTYTEAAAAHLKGKVSKALRGDASQLHAHTFHAYCNNLLQQVDRGFGVLDEKDLWVFLRRRVQDLNLNLYLPARDPGQFLSALCQFFSRCHDELVDVAAYERYVARLRAGEMSLPRVAPHRQDGELSDADKLARCSEIAAVFRRVEELLSAGIGNGSLGTYGHMISGAVQLLREDARVLRQAQEGARFILIDEFQDANVAQIELARLLAGDERNVFAVGDPDQAIFHFRGASSESFEEFLRRFPGARGVVLNENQRSTSKILACAHAVVRQNPGVDCHVAPGVDFHRERLISAREQPAIPSPATPTRRKTRSASSTLPLFADVLDDDVGSVIPQPVSIVFGDKYQEATDVAEEIQALFDSGWAGSIAVIYRQHTHAPEVAHALAARGVPAMVKGIDALETPEGRDLLAVLAAVSSLSNVDALFRVSAMPMFAVDGAEVVRRLHADGRKSAYTTLLPSIRGGEAVMTKIEAARAYAASVEWKAEPISRYVVREFWLDGSGPVDRISRFIADWSKKAVTEKGTLEEFVEYMRYFVAAGGRLEISSEPTEDCEEPVQLMTAHSAKGREFDRVFVLRANKGSFPNHYKETFFEFPQALREMPAADDSKALNDQEERRLFYVAMTRARDFLTIYGRATTIKNKPAFPPGFLRDLEKDRAVNDAWVQRPPRPAKVARIEAAAAPQSGVAGWMLAPPTFLEEEPVLSATAIEAYDTCPLKYKLSREWYLPGPASAALLYGNVLHSALRGLHDAEVQGRAFSQELWLETFQRLMDDAHFADPVQADLYRQQGARHLTEYLRLRNQRERLPILQVENNFRVTIADVEVKGRMDRVDDAAGVRRIVDFKTGKPFTQMKADKSVQLGIYALAARESWGAAEQELVIYNIEDNTEVVSERSDKALADLAARVRQIANEIRESVASGYFEAQPDFHCQWCDFRTVCPATEQRLYSITRTAVTN